MNWRHTFFSAGVPHLATAAIAQWNTVSLERARPALRQTGKLQCVYESESKSMPQ